MIDVKKLAELAGLKSGDNQHFADGFRYRSLGCQNVKESDLEAFAALVLEEAAKEVQPANFNTPSDWTEYAKTRAECAMYVRAMKPKGTE